MTDEHATDKESLPNARLLAALARAQGEIEPAPKDATNTFFKSKYATLASVREAIRGPFAKHGLSVLQIAQSQESERDPTKAIVSVQTILCHESGETMDCKALSCEVKNDPQALGSAITYFRRYAIGAVAQCVTDDDDDAEAAHGRGATQRPQQAPQRPARPTAPAKSSLDQPVSAEDVAGLRDILATCPPEEIPHVVKGATYKRLSKAGPAEPYKEISENASARYNAWQAERAAEGSQ